MNALMRFVRSPDFCALQVVWGVVVVFTVLLTLSWVNTHSIEGLAICVGMRSFVPVIGAALGLAWIVARIGVPGNIAVLDRRNGGR